MRPRNRNRASCRIDIGGEDWPVRRKREEKEEKQVLIVVEHASTFFVEREKERELRDTWGLGKSAIRLPTVTRCVCVSTLAEKEKKGKRRDPHNRVAWNYIHGYYRR